MRRNVIQCVPIILIENIVQAVTNCQKSFMPPILQPVFANIVPTIGTKTMLFPMIRHGGHGMKTMPQTKGNVIINVVRVILEAQTFLR